MLVFEPQLGLSYNIAISNNYWCITNSCFQLLKARICNDPAEIFLQKQNNVLVRSSKRIMKGSKVGSFKSRNKSNIHYLG